MFCTCIAGDSKGCYLCNPRDFIKYKGCWYRKDDSIFERKEAEKMPKDCGCGERRMSSPAPTPADREYHVDVQLERLERNTEFLNDAINCLATKLIRILRPDAPVDKGNQAVSCPQTPLAEEIFKYNNAIENSIDYLRTIAERIEIDQK